ncbi:hypothetical protein B0T13DRAFT_529521 [Neurospora crassa]|nr:hypothetical protein B0T13DRAFT_529521 [Neurospora crassa]
MKWLSQRIPEASGSLRAEVSSTLRPSSCVLSQAQIKLLRLSLALAIDTSDSIDRYDSSNALLLSVTAAAAAVIQRLGNIRLTSVPKIKGSDNRIGKGWSATYRGRIQIRTQLPRGRYLPWPKLVSRATARLVIQIADARGILRRPKSGRRTRSRSRSRSHPLDLTRRYAERQEPPHGVGTTVDTAPIGIPRPRRTSGPDHPRV